MRHFFLLVISILLYNCVNNDALLLESDKLTIEGRIEEGKFARVFLTNSLPFRGIIDSLEVVKTIETKAKVVLSDGKISEILTVKKDVSRFPYLYYRSNLIKGKIGDEYELSVTIRGKEFVSKTSIPKKVEVISYDFLDWNNDGVIHPNFKEIKLTIRKSKLKNTYYKILIKNEKEQKYELARPYIFNTESVTTDTFPVIVNYIKTNEDGENESQIKVNEIIEMQLIAITKEQFDFWKSIFGDKTTILENASFTNEVESNISNGGFGYWSGENVVYFKFNIPN